jgi:cytochrome c oxidase assembly protein subunit 15
MQLVASSRIAARTPDAARARPRAVAAWLLVCCALVFLMVIVGGVTRLTHSGLSITEWDPIVGTVPPLSTADWQEAFTKYQATPEFKQVNHAMTLDEFKGIFWWEYFHRLLGRAIGVVFLVPFLWFLARRQIPRGYTAPLATIFVLGGLQGALGWYMVKSGLVQDPHVSQFRLTAHLGLAVLIFAAMLWTAMTLLAPARATPANKSLRRGAYVLAALVFVQILLGGLVAGIRAGFAYNTFPSMNGHFIPPEVLMIEPAWRNFFWNMATVQLDHRLVAYALAIGVTLFAFAVHRTRVTAPRVRGGTAVFVAMLALQITLGVLTLVYVVPLPLAALHQAGAVLTLALALNVAHALR